MASGFDRTINSANLVNSAMFPPKDNQIWNEQLPVANLWQPVPVHSIPKPYDYFIHVEDACARYSKGRHDYEISPEIRAIIEPHKKLFQYLEQHTGTPIRTIENLKDIHETLIIERSLNKT